MLGGAENHVVNDKSRGRCPVDWESVEREYRAGVRSLRDIGTEYGCSEGAIRKRAKSQEWERDLSAKVAAKAEALVRKTEVRNEVRSEAAISEREQINVSAQMLADKVLGQREDVRRARATVQRLWSLVDAELDCPEELRTLGELMAAPDENGQDKLNDLYHAAIGLPQQIKNVKLLADAIKVLIELERKVLRIDDQPPTDGNPLTELVRAINSAAVPLPVKK